MRQIVAGFVLLSLGAAGSVSATDHLVSAGVVQERVAEVDRDRERNIAAVDALLDTPEAARLGAASGIDIGSLKRQVALLSDADLRDLSRRAGSLKTDPVMGSGTSDWVAATLIAIPLAMVAVWVFLTILSGLG